MYPDLRSATVRPEKIKEDALKCRGTVYYKLAEHERRPSERIRLAALARHDQGEWSRVAHEKLPRGSRWRVRLTPELDTGLRMVALMAALALTAVLWVLHGTNQMIWTTTMVVSLPPLFIAVILLTALLPQLQSLKLAGLQAQTSPFRLARQARLGPLTAYAGREPAKNFWAFVKLQRYTCIQSPGRVCPMGTSRQCPVLPEIRDSSRPNPMP
jgi:hypothetical protein